MCRSRRELSNEYLLAKIGVDTAENEPLEVWGKNSIHYSLHSLGRGEAADCAAEEAALLEGVRRVLFVVISRRATWREHLVLVRPRPITR